MVVRILLAALESLRSDDVSNVIAVEEYGAGELLLRVPCNIAANYRKRNAES